MSVSITTIDLLRHGECVDGQCYRGSSDVALSHTGFAQMEQSLYSFIASRHKEYQNKFIKTVPWKKIVSSPLVRCLNFSQHISEQNNLPLDVEAGFQEMHFGEWEGQRIDHVWESQSEAVAAWIANPVASPPPSGEAADVFSQRVTSTFEALLQRSAGEHILLVSHGGVMRVLLAHCLAMSVLELNRFDVPYACMSRIQVVTDQGKHYYRLLMHNVGVG